MRLYNISIKFYFRLAINNKTSKGQGTFDNFTFSILFTTTGHNKNKYISGTSFICHTKI